MTKILTLCVFLVWLKRGRAQGGPSGKGPPVTHERPGTASRWNLVPPTGNPRPKIEHFTEIDACSVYLGAGHFLGTGMIFCPMPIRS